MLKIIIIIDNQILLQINHHVYKQLIKTNKTKKAHHSIGGGWGEAL